MANPQKENGYTAVANEILEALIRSGLNGTEYGIVLLLLRKTYGFHKKEDEISLSQFLNYIPVTKPSLCKALKNLQLVKIIKLVKKGKSINSSNQYAFLKNYDEWQLVKKSKLVKKKKRTSKGLDNQLVNKPLHTKETSTKERTQKKRYKDFVFLSDSEMEKLRLRLGGNFDDYMERLNNYIGSKGKKYKSHYYTILSWYKKDNPRDTGVRNLKDGELTKQFLNKTNNQPDNENS